jgi:hypothetical protein
VDRLPGGMAGLLLSLAGMCWPQGVGFGGSHFLDDPIPQAASLASSCANTTTWACAKAPEHLKPRTAAEWMVCTSNGTGEPMRRIGASRNAVMVNGR